MRPLRATCFLTLKISDDLSIKPIEKHGKCNIDMDCIESFREELTEQGEIDPERTMVHMKSLDIYAIKMSYKEFTKLYYNE